MRRDKDEIPESLQRSKMGTDIIVVGFPKEKNWQNDLTYSVLENFWPAIDLGDLEVTVGDDRDRVFPSLPAHVVSRRIDLSLESERRGPLARHRAGSLRPSIPPVSRARRPQMLAPA